jgi:hypothetical protein
MSGVHADRMASKNEKRNAYMRRYTTTDRGGLYSRWRLMVRRCCDPSHKNYPTYGARGIELCEEWKSFEAFYEWGIANGWKPGLQIDRVDNGRGYSPENCRWTTSQGNNRNRSNNKLDVEKVAEIRQLLADGVSGPQLAKRFGVHHSLIYRIKLNQQWV